MPAIWAELVLAHFQRLQTRNAAQDFGSVSPAQSAFHYYNSLKIHLKFLVEPNYEEGIGMLERRYDKYLNLDGDYVEN
ncbi:hypothetical protein J6590_042285 [Homalodisca vitripennis]|nr:hypothetical protein J6590_042285 [Homalodisca vitripennis]